MPSEEVIDQRRFSSLYVPTVSSSFFSEEIRYPAQRQVGFWKSELESDNHNNIGKPGIHGLDQHAMFLHPRSLNVNGNKIDKNEIPYESESSLCSSSMSGIQNKNLVYSNLEKDETFESMKEMEAHTIGNLLPDEDGLFSRVINEVEVDHISLRNNSNADDLFYIGGGMEYENNGVPNIGEFIYSTNPSRTLFVNYIENLDDADLRALFEKYGDIHMLYTSCKYHGFVIIHYYDLRSAINIMREHQSKLLIHRKLDMHFVVSKKNLSDRNINKETLTVSGLDSSFSKDCLKEIFSVYGEIKEIHEITQNCQFKFIEFYDTRASEAALHALNGIFISGKRIQLYFSHGLGSGLMDQMPYEMEQEEATLCHKKGSPQNCSPSLCYGIPFEADGFNNSAIQGKYSVSQESSFSFLHLTSPVTVESVKRNYNQPKIDDLNKSLGELNIGLQQMPTFQPHHSSNTMHIPGVNSARFQSFVNNEDGKLKFELRTVFGASENSNYLPIDHQYIWNKPSSHDHHSSGSLMWLNSPPSTSNTITHPPQLHGISSAHSNILNGVLPLHHHHVGSAPTYNLSILDKHHVYNEDWTNRTIFQPGSLGTTGFSSSSMQHPLEYISSNMITQVGRQCNVTSISSSSVGLSSHQPKYRRFHGGRNSMIPIPTVIDSIVDRTRSQKKYTSSNQTINKKRYGLDIDRIIHGEDSRTTLMIKNIPNKYTSKMLLATIDENHHGTYDFIYLPIDFKNKCNVGYAFINLIDPQHIIPFHKSFNGKKWEKFNSEKVALLAYARIQGKTALIAHFQNSSLLNEDKRCRPILFHSDGPNAGDQEPFPLGMAIRTRRGRNQNSEDIHHGSPLNSTSSR
ncbi:Protein MEI2-like 4 [Zostera marina]|uniref:Protein MEI2-like 4 n=1 Tax=Zostera marina TaxID=29655 RepID=A0A0K9NK31_ZOSMR|nr:Protein MEI2-like 4 [Zostera marina]